MQPGTKKFLRFLQTWAINTLAVLVAVEFVPGIRFNDSHWFTPFVTSLVLGILNAFVRPILMFLALPLLIFTLGLFTLVINALLLYLVGQSPFFTVNSFGSAFIGALVISVVSILLNVMTGSARVSLQRKSTEKKSKDDDVIDV